MSGHAQDVQVAVTDVEGEAVATELRQVVAIRESLFPPIAPSERELALGEWLAGLDEQHAALATIQETVARDDRQLLLLDLTSGAEPRAAVAVGDVATADHVAVLTPGYGTTVAGSLPGYTDSVAALRQEAMSQLAAAGRDETVATVAWSGYDAPQPDTAFTSGQSVLTQATAQAGGHQLAGFLDGIDISRDSSGGGDPHLTALGHSFGSTTTGFALQEARGVDDAAIFGSPGGSTSDLDRLNIDPGRIAVLEATEDPTADLGAFGGDPNRLPGVVELSTERATAPDGRPLTESVGHSAYLIPGTTSQYKLAATVAGLPEQRITGEHEDFGDLFRGGPGAWADASY